MDYDPQMLRTAPAPFRRQLDASARADGHRRHSMLSLAVELEVYPHRVFDAVTLMIATVDVQEPELDADALERAAFDGDRYQGSIDLPSDHPLAADGFPSLGDMYLTDDAVTYVRESIRRPTFHAPSLTRA